MEKNTDFFKTYYVSVGTPFEERSIERERPVRVPPGGVVYH